MRLANAVRRALAICCIAAGALLGSALPASAHTLGPGVAAMNYRTRLLSVSPQVSGVRFQVVDDGLHVIATNSGATPLVIDGYAGEPYLRVDRSGSWENLRSPATYLDQSFTPGAVPTIADAKAAPVWHRLGTVDWVRWHDHRLHWMGPQPPVQVQAHPGAFNLISVWQLNAKYGAREIRVTGTLAWVPGSSPVGWILVLALSLALAVVVGWKWRHGPGPRIVLGGLILTDLARSVGLVEGRGGSLRDRLQALPWRGVPELLLALIVVGAITLGGRRRILAAYVCVFAGLAVLLLDGAVSLSALWRSQVIAWHPWWLERALIAGTVGGALGAAAVGALLLARRPTPTSPTPPSSRPRLRAVAAAGALFTVAGCSGGGSHSAQPVAVDTAPLPRIGSVLTDAGGHVLYLFVPDHRRAVSCSEVCQGSWPPLVVPAGASVTAMGAARQRLLGEVRNPVGGPAVATYNGWPLYTYVGDVAPGTANGQALNLNGGLWYLLAPDGAVVKTPVAA
jgi:predicted lipoprotein with Yx(FWY)xxD motif